MFRYNIDSWLELIEEADEYFPKTHQVLYSSQINPRPEFLRFF